MLEKHISFNFDDIGFESYSDRGRSRANMKRRDRNVQKFADWLVGTMKTHAPRELRGGGEKYDTTGVRMSPSNCQKIHEALTGADAMGYVGRGDSAYGLFWLNYSPVEDEGVRDDEIVVSNWFRQM